MATRNERFPYWAEVWPSSIALAQWFSTRKIESSPVLELGCGLGLLGISLAGMGWRVQATDFIEDALIFAHHNASTNRVSGRHRVGYLDWRHPIGEPFDLIVAADILYEKKSHSILARLLRHLLAPGGQLFVSDPNRPSAVDFVGLLKAKGYQHQSESLAANWLSSQQQVNIHLFKKPR